MSHDDAPRNTSRAALSTIAELLVGRVDDDHDGLLTNDTRWTWSEVVAECSTRAAILDELGVQGTHVGVLLANVPEYVFLLGGAALGRSVVVGINPTRRGPELVRDISHTDCSLVLTDREHLSLIDETALGVPVRLVDDDEWAQLVEDHRDAQLPSTVPEADDLYLLMFTSGSTSAPKAVRMTQGRAARTAASSAVAFTPDDVLYCSMPLFHGNALLANLFAGLVSGASIALRERFSASSFLPDVRRFGCTYFNYVGRALAHLLAQPERPDDADNPLQWCLGSEASPRDREEFRRRFGCFVVEGYSSSEGGIIIQPFSGMAPEALGRAVEGSDVAVVNPVTGAECDRARFDADGHLANPTAAIGEIVRRDGLGGFEGYYANPHADAERSRNGWYWSGDLAYRDADGTFYFAGRSTDWLRVDSENFAAGPIEAILGRVPGVRVAVVYGVPDPRTGDQVMAAIELDDDFAFDPEKFASSLDSQPDLGTKWAPRFVRVTTSFPLTANGKVDRQLLRRQRWDTDDPVWWRTDRSGPYRELTRRDVEELRDEFVASGRSSLLR